MNAERLLQRAGVSEVLLEVSEVTMVGPSRGAGSAHARGSVPRERKEVATGKGSTGLYTAESETTRMCLVTGSARAPGLRALRAHRCPALGALPARTAPLPRLWTSPVIGRDAGGRVSAGPKGHQRRAHPSALGVKVEAQKDPEIGDGESRAC